MTSPDPKWQTLNAALIVKGVREEGRNPRAQSLSNQYHIEPQTEPAGTARPVACRCVGRSLSEKMSKSQSQSSRLGARGRDEDTAAKMPNPAAAPRHRAAMRRAGVATPGKQLMKQLLKLEKLLKYFARPWRLNL